MGIKISKKNFIIKFFFTYFRLSIFKLIKCQNKNLLAGNFEIDKT